MQPVIALMRNEISMKVESQRPIARLCCCSNTQVVKEAFWMWKDQKILMCPIEDTC